MTDRTGGRQRCERLDARREPFSWWSSTLRTTGGHGFHDGGTPRAWLQGKNARRRDGIASSRVHTHKRRKKKKNKARSSCACACACVQRKRGLASYTATPQSYCSMHHTEKKSGKNNNEPGGS